MSISISQVDPKNRTEYGRHPDVVKNAICKHFSVLNQEKEKIGCCCDVSESSNYDCNVSECSDNECIIDDENKIRSFNNSNGELVKQFRSKEKYQLTETPLISCKNNNGDSVEKITSKDQSTENCLRSCKINNDEIVEQIGSNHHLTENPLRSCKNNNGDLIEKITSKDEWAENPDLDFGVSKSTHDDCDSEESTGNECVQDNKIDLKLLANRNGDLEKDAYRGKDKVTENSVFISESNATSNLDTVRKIWSDGFEYLNKLRKKPRFRVALFVCSFSVNILLIILIYLAARSKKKDQYPGYIESIVPSVKCSKDEFKSVACWSCSVEDTFQSSGKAIQKYIHNGEIVCCVKHVPYVQSMVEVMNNEHHRMKQSAKRINKRQAQADVPVAIHVELSQKISKDGNLNWETPSDWRSSTNVVGTISQSKGVFKIPFNGLYTVYESLITRFKNSSSRTNDEYIHVRIHKNSGRTTYKVLIQRNFKRWTGLQVYQGASSMASFYLQKGDDVELFLSDSDLILYKSQGINHFGIYKH